MALVPTALLFLIGEDLDRALQLQSQFLRAGIRNPIFAIRDFKESKLHLLRLAEEKNWSNAEERQVAILSLDRNRRALEFLAWLRGQRVFRNVFVIMRVDRSCGNELQLALDLGANGFHYQDCDSRLLAAELRALTLCSPAPQQKAI